MTHQLETVLGVRVETEVIRTPVITRVKVGSVLLWTPKWKMEEDFSVARTPDASVGVVLHLSKTLDVGFRVIVVGVDVISDAVLGVNWINNVRIGVKVGRIFLYYSF